MEDKKLFQIGEVAKMFQLSVGSLRHYEKAGLLKPEYTDNMQFNIRLSMLIKGSFYAFYDNYHKYDNAALIDEICAFLGQCTR